jgi:trans-2,3-dihydro-3-hydroxyanthranilate isomerase
MMKVTISWWDLSQSPQTIESLRDYLIDEGIAPWERIDGLVLKFWISDPATNRWGAVMLWDSAEAAKGPMPPNRALELIGHPPEIRLVADMEALVGRLQINGRADEGLAWTPAKVAP